MTVTKMHLSFALNLHNVATKTSFLRIILIDFDDEIVTKLHHLAAVKFKSSYAVMNVLILPTSTSTRIVTKIALYPNET